MGRGLRGPIRKPPRRGAAPGALGPPAVPRGAVVPARLAWQDNSLRLVDPATGDEEPARLAKG